MVNSDQFFFFVEVNDSAKINTDNYLQKQTSLKSMLKGEKSEDFGK